MLNDQTYHDHFDSLLLDHNTEQHSQDTELRACIGKQAHPRQHDTTHPSQLISAGTPTRCLHTPRWGQRCALGWPFFPVPWSAAVWRQSPMRGI